MGKSARMSSPKAKVPSAGDASPIKGKSENPLASPITLGEMHELIEPLRSCLFRVERALQDLPRTSPPAVQWSQLPFPAPPEADNATNNAAAAEDSDRRQSVITEDLNVSHEKHPQVTSVDDDVEEDTTKKKKDMSAHLDVAKVLREEGLMEDVTTLDMIALRLEKSARWWEALEEPDHNDWVHRVVKSSIFENICISVIIFNSALVAYTSDWNIQNFAQEEPASFDIMQRVCFFWFILELIMRMMAHRIHFFINDDMKWNIFDLTLVTISVVDFVFTLIASAQKGGGNLAFMRVLRLLKLARIFRSLRSFRFFKSLEQLLTSFQKSFTSLFWGLVMLAFVLYLFTLVFMQACIDYLHESPDDPAGALNFFGSFGKTWLSLYMSVTGGSDWGDLYHILAETGWVYGLLLVFFTFFFLFALFNILTGVLVEKAIVTTKPERTDMILRTRKAIAQEKKQFLRLCKAMDQDGDGVISWDEFQTWMCNPVMLSYMASIGIEIYDAELFFNTVAAREGRHGTLIRAGEVSIDHFVEGCMHMKGSATALDMQRQLFEMHVLHHDLKHVDHMLTKKFQDLEYLIGHTFRSTENLDRAYAHSSPNGCEHVRDARGAALRKVNTSMTLASAIDASVQVIGQRNDCILNDSRPSEIASSMVVTPQRLQTQSADNACIRNSRQPTDIGSSDEIRLNLPRQPPSSHVGGEDSLQKEWSNSTIALEMTDNILTNTILYANALQNMHEELRRKGLRGGQPSV